MDWSIILAILISIVATPVIVTGTTSVLDMLLKDRFSQEWGSRATAIVGGAGIITHEFGHAIAAVIFRHRILHVKLLQIRNLDLTSTFGSVEHSWDASSFYQKLGNFFIGIAPFFSCSGLLCLLHYLLIGTRHSYLGRPMNVSGIAPAVSVFNNALRNVSANLADDIQHPLLAALFTLLVIAVSLAGFSISEADWKNVRNGAAYYTVFAIVLTAVWLCLGSYWPQASAYAWKLASCLAFLMIDSWAYLLATFCITEIVRMIARPGTRGGISIGKSIRNLLAPKGRHFHRKE